MFTPHVAGLGKGYRLPGLGLDLIWQYTQISDYKLFTN